MNGATHILVLDDGETWEVVTATSSALVVTVSAAELEELSNGSPVAAVLSGRTGTRVAAMLIDVKP